MAKGFKHGAGGTSLNFKVVAYATVEELTAATPKANTIGVITGDKITSWDFTASEPTAPTEGMVWIPIGTASPVSFNALKKNGIQVYPISAKQYVGGAWVDVEAKSFQNGVWVDFVTYLLNGANLCEGITGGWVQTSDVSISGLSNTGTVSFSDDGISLSCGGSVIAAICRTKNKIDFNGKTTLTGTMKAGTVNGNNSIRLYVIGGLGDLDSNLVARYENVTDTSFKDYDLDVSHLNGEYYVAIVVDRTRTGTLKKLVLK